VGAESARELAGVLCRTLNIHMHIHVHTHIHVHIRIHIHKYMHVHIHRKLGGVARRERAGGRAAHKDS